jgi:hypothetical protein
MQQRRQGEPDAAVTGLAGSSTHAASDSAVAASVLRSSQAGTFSCRPGSADIVNAGITRPAITHSIITTRANPACSARSGSMFSQPSTAA